MRKLLSVFVLIVATVVTASLLAACGSVAPYAATVNGARIPQSDLTDELNAILHNKAYVDGIEQQLAQQGQHVRGKGSGTFDSGFVAQVLTRRIYLELVHQDLATHHIAITASKLKKGEEELKQQFGDDKVLGAFPKKYREVLAARTAEVDALQERLTVTPDDAAVKRYYDENIDQYSACVRHVLAALPQDHPPTPDELAKAKAKAEGWKARLDKGEDFAAIADKETEDPTNKGKGGSLGCPDPAQLVGEFSAVMTKLAPNQISDPVQTKFGFHIIQAIPKTTRPIAEVSAEIRTKLQADDRSALSTFIDKAITKAKVVVNPKYGRFNRKGGQPSVVPPNAPSTTTTTAAPGPEQFQGGGVPGGGPGDQAPPDQAPSP